MKEDEGECVALVGKSRFATMSAEERGKVMAAACVVAANKAWAYEEARNGRRPEAMDPGARMRAAMETLASWMVDVSAIAMKTRVDLVERAGEVVRPRLGVAEEGVGNAEGQSQRLEEGRVVEPSDSGGERAQRSLF